MDLNIRMQYFTDETRIVKRMRTNTRTWGTTHGLDSISEILKKK
jgi:hypothetical protein